MVVKKEKNKEKVAKVDDKCYTIDDLINKFNKGKPILKKRRRN